MGRTATKFHSKAGANAGNVRRILEAREGHTDLYRTVVAGPSGQRGDLLIARVRYTWTGPFEFSIILSDGPFAGERAGYAYRSDKGGWAIFEDIENGPINLLGHASSLSLGCDVLINGVHAATGRHDSHRITGGKWEPYTPPTDY